MISRIISTPPDVQKTALSDVRRRLRQQGVQIDPNDISDQMLYSQIATNPDLRASITSVLRARGYVSDFDLQSAGSGDMNGPRWSPEGCYLAAVVDAVHLKIFDLKTRHWSELPQSGPVDSPEWSRDGQFICFKRVAGNPGVFRIRVNGGAPEKMVDLKDWHDTGWWGAYMGWTLLTRRCWFAPLQAQTFTPSLWNRNE